MDRSSTQPLRQVHLAEVGTCDACLRSGVSGSTSGWPLESRCPAPTPVAMARQPLSSIGGWVARLDDEAAARRHAASVGPELEAALRIITELGRWQDAFA
jgi:hypothetical protein